MWKKILFYFTQVLVLSCLVLFISVFFVSSSKSFLFGYKPIVIDGDGLLPEYSDGTMCIVKEAKLDELKPDDTIVLFYDDCVRFSNYASLEYLSSDVVIGRVVYTLFGG